MHHHQTGHLPDEADRDRDDPQGDEALVQRQDDDRPTACDTVTAIRL